jgi:hypothetical protein
LNSDKAMLEAKRRWGGIKHPSVEELVAMVLLMVV